MKNILLSLSAIIISFLLLQAPASAQEASGGNDTLYSSILEQKRPIEVILPPG
jgi:hypothetical protein